MSRGMLVGVCAAVFFITLIGCTGPAWPIVLPMLATDGLLAAAWVLCAGALGWSLLRWWREPLGLTLTVATAAALGLGIYSLAALGLGLAGVLNRFTAAAMPVISLVIWAIGLYRRHGRGAIRPPRALRTALRQPATWGWLWVAAMPFLGLAVAAASVQPGLLWWPNDPHPYDVLEYHLQVPREWFDAHRIIPLRHNVFSFMPFNVEMQYLLAMHLHRGVASGMYLAQYLSLAQMIIAVLAIAGAAQHRSKAAPHLAGVAAAATPWLPLLGSICYNESGLLMYGSAALGCMLRGLDNPRHRRALWIIAGLMAGLAAGTKLTALAMVVAALALGGVTACFMRNRPGPDRPPSDNAPTAFALPLVGFLLAATLAFGPWAIRNTAWAGNPLFPTAMRLLGPGHFTPQQVERFDNAHRARPDQRSLAKRFEEAERQIFLDWRYGYVLLPLGCAGLALGWKDRRIAAALAVFLLANLLIWMFATHLQSRFFVLGISAAAVGIGMVRGRAATGAVAGLLLLGGAVSFGHLYVDFKEFLEPSPEVQRYAFFGLEDLSARLREDIASVVYRGEKVALIGDAQALLYNGKPECQLPMSHLKYSTVFDFPDGQDSLLTRWLNDQHLPGWYVVIDPVELRRLAASYHLGPVPAKVADEQQPMLVHP